jgi:hypothetical protein
MSTTRRTFLAAAGASLASSAVSNAQQSEHLNPVEIAARHKMVRELATPDFFEGMLLGNGDVGVCVTVRPDALGLHIGKEDCWDIRVSEDHAEHVLPFAKVLEMWGRASERAKKEGKHDTTYLETSDPDLRAYVAKVRASYDKPWPRPWPCGTVWIHWDPRWVRVLQQTLDISTGVYTLDLRLSETDTASIECFVSRDLNHIFIASNRPVPVTSVAYYPHFDAKVQMPPPVLRAVSNEFSLSQRLPATAPAENHPAPSASPQDREFALHGRLAGWWADFSFDDRRHRTFHSSTQVQLFRLDLALLTTRDDSRPYERAQSEVQRLSGQPRVAIRGASAAAWASFWSKSAVDFEDKELERIWYHNQYFLACCLKPGAVAPGLFGNWSSGNIGTAWHGDYHMNYNTQQVYWGVFSSNHVEQHLPYVELVESLMTMAEWNARVQFGLPGAYFPHSAYPVPSKVNPYPVPPWGYEICETPWTVQSLWWHYLYTLDNEYLKRAYPILRAAAEFVAAYAKKGADGKYHITPTVSPENWGLTVDFRLNRDCIIDLALAQFLLDAVVSASKTLDRDAGPREKWAEIRGDLAPYPFGNTKYGAVWLDVTEAPAEWVYNVPVTLAPVFPGDQVGLDRNADQLYLARKTADTIRLEGGNDLVWQPLARARLGILDLDWFKREVRYCLLPNGVANDRARQIGGRYHDETSFDFMMRMGVWTENLSLPAVLNECLLHSYSGIIRLFPNTRNLGKAKFDHLRTVGAFVVSAEWDGATISNVRITSEKGATARIVNPWPGREVLVKSVRTAIESRTEHGIVTFETKPGESYDMFTAA